MLINSLTSSLLCLGSTLENTIPPVPLSAFILAESDYKFSNSSPVKLFPAVLLFESRMSSSLAIDSAVSLLSPVIIMTLIPAVLQSWIAPLTSALTGSLMHMSPRKVPPVSYSIYLLMSLSFSSLLVSFKSPRAPAS